MNFASKSQCHRCGAPPPMPEGAGGGGDDDDDDDAGVYTMGGVTYLDGKRHVEKLRRGVEAQVWVESLETWVDCVIVGVQEHAVAHTSIVRRTFTCSYFPPGATTTTTTTTGAAASGGGGSGGANYVPRSMAGHYGPSSSSAGASAGAASGGGAPSQEAAPTTITNLAADQFRLIALNEQGEWQENSAAKDEARAAKLDKKTKKRQQQLGEGLGKDGEDDEEEGRGTPPPPDPDTG